MLIKGESSFWVNKQKLLKTNFEWQDEYIVLSVSYSAIDKVRSYILNQEEHHKKKSFTQEYEEFLNAHHFEKDLAKANT
jgi:REP element-mobilizing transposase RayT